MRSIIFSLYLAFIVLAYPLQVTAQENPLIRKTLNERIEFGNLQPEHIGAFREYTLTQVNRLLEEYFTEPYPALNENNILFPLDKIDDLFYNSSVLYAFAEIHPVEAIRNLCYSEMNILDSASQSIYQNKQIYNRLIALQNAKGSELIPASHQKAIAGYLEKFLENGVHLELENKEKFQELSNTLFSTGMEFMMNSQMLKDTFYTTKDRLAGMSDTFLESHESDDGKYFFAVPGPDYDEILEYADDEEIRKQAYFMQKNFAYEANKDLLNKMIELRSNKAKLLGYENYTVYKLKDNMVKNIPNLEKFLNDLTPGINALMDKHHKELIAFNQDKEVNPWDVVYLERKKFLHDTHLDLEALKMYFPSEKVIAGLLEITGQMFNIEYKEVPVFSSWHEDVRLFEIFSNQKLIGTIYLDMYEHEGKSAQGASCMPIVPAKKIGASKQNAQLVLVASLPNAEPSLLSTQDILMIFHELGHAMNFLFQENEFIAQSIENGEWDFIEIPSTIFEVGVWEREIVKRITAHVETHETLPDSFLQSLSAKVKQEQINRAAALLYYGICDFKLHTHYDKWTDGQYHTMLKETWEEVFPNPFPESGKNPLTGFFILGAENYAASFYTFLWALVYAQDVLSVFRSDEILNPVLWDRYRKEILAPGASKPANESLVNFLGREPNQGAFLKAYGLE